MRYLIITSSGGGAHTTVAKAERDSLLKQGVKIGDIQIVDIMGVDHSVATHPGETWIPNYEIPNTPIKFFSGSTNVAAWNQAQQKGGVQGVKELEQLVNLQPYAEQVQANTIYSSLKKFIKANPDLQEIIDTQALSTPEICRAVTEENEQRSIPITVRKIISEFITDKTVHYLDPLSRLTEQQAKCLTVETVNEPLRTANESSTDFYKRKKLGHIKFEVKPAPLRAEFKTDYAQDKILYFNIAADEAIEGPLKEQSYINELLNGKAEACGNHFKMLKGDKDLCALIVLGSQSSTTMLRYIDTYIDQTIQNSFDPSQTQILFVAAGKNDGRSNTMYALVRQHIDQRMAELNASGITWPPSVKIVPLSFQDDKGMASLFQNVDELVIRTGGMSSIEAHATQAQNRTRRVYLHSESSPERSDLFPKSNFDACYSNTIAGTVRWEGGNAEYLMTTIGACLASPETIVFHSNQAPSYKKSLLEMAVNGTFNMDELEHCLNMGSDPNIEVFGVLPLLAYIKDLEQAKLLIEFGGKITPKALEQFNNESARQLIKLAAEVEKHIRTIGAPEAVLERARDAIKQNNIEQIKGLFYRYPKLAFSMRPEVKEERIQHIIKRTQGISALQLAFEHGSNEATPTLKRMIYLHQNELNKECRRGVTLLTLCHNKSLRELMVALGANPKYLSQNISNEERNTLKTHYATSKAVVNQLKRFILNQYAKNPENELEFCAKLVDYLDIISLNTRPKEQLTVVAKEVFFGLKAAKSQIAQMGFIERFIDWIRTLWSGDISSCNAELQSRKILFHQSISDESPGVSISKELYPCPFKSFEI